MESLLVAGLVLVIAVFLFRRARRSARRDRAGAVAFELLPEIRAVADSSDPHGETGGAPVEPTTYRRYRDELERLLPPDAHFAVAAFYRSVEDYAEARLAVERAFAEGSELSLGDRIRAKDRRDRCLKDVYDAGQSASEKLEALAR